MVNDASTPKYVLNAETRQRLSDIAATLYEHEQAVKNMNLYKRVAEEKLAALSHLASFEAARKTDAPKLTIMAMLRVILIDKKAWPQREILRQVRNYSRISASTFRSMISRLARDGYLVHHKDKELWSLAEDPLN
ncbi:MAG: hypothetical protein AAFR74_04455 [Pseudomonadota bacterium]